MNSYRFLEELFSTKFVWKYILRVHYNKHFAIQTPNTLKVQGEYIVYEYWYIWIDMYWFSRCHTTLDEKLYYFTLTAKRWIKVHRELILRNIYRIRKINIWRILERLATISLSWSIPQTCIVANISRLLKELHFRKEENL